MSGELGASYQEASDASVPAALATTPQPASPGGPGTVLLLDGSYGEGPDAIDRAAERAAAVTLALIQGRAALQRPRQEQGSAIP